MNTNMYLGFILFSKYNCRAKKKTVSLENYISPLVFLIVRLGVVSNFIVRGKPHFISILLRLQTFASMRALLKSSPTYFTIKQRKMFYLHVNFFLAQIKHCSQQSKTAKKRADSHFKSSKPLFPPSRLSVLLAFGGVRSSHFSVSSH